MNLSTHTTRTYISILHVYTCLINELAVGLLPHLDIAQDLYKYGRVYM